MEETKNSTTDQDRWYNFVSTVYSPFKKTIPRSVVYLFDSRYPVTTGACNMNTLAHEVLSVFSSTVHLVTFSQAWLSVDAPSVQCPTKAYPTKKFSGSYWCASCCLCTSHYDYNNNSFTLFDKHWHWFDKTLIVHGIRVHTNLLISRGVNSRYSAKYQNIQNQAGCLFIAVCLCLNVINKDLVW